MKQPFFTLICLSALLTACDSGNETKNASTADATPMAKEEVRMEEGTVEEAAVMEKTEDSTDSTDSPVSSAEPNSDEMMTSEAKKTTEMTDAVAAVSDDGQGQEVYKKACLGCHAYGAAGAPRTGDKSAWESRIAQGDEVLIEHAVKGYKGNAGYMPPKGGSMSLSDADVAAAVLFMVSLSK